jgi:hypothetical protein
MQAQGMMPGQGMPQGGVPESMPQEPAEGMPVEMPQEGAIPEVV